MGRRESGKREDRRERRGRERWTEPVDKGLKLPFSSLVINLSLTCQHRVTISTCGCTESFPSRTRVKGSNMKMRSTRSFSPAFFHSIPPSATSLSASSFSPLPAAVRTFQEPVHRLFFHLRIG